MNFWTQCSEVSDVFAELEEIDIAAVDTGRYGFVIVVLHAAGKLWERCCFHGQHGAVWKFVRNSCRQFITPAKEMNIDIDYNNIFKRLLEEKQKADFQKFKNLYSL